MGFFGHFFHLFSTFFASFFCHYFHTHFFGRFGVVFWTQNRSFLPSETSEPPPLFHFFGRPTLLSVSRCLLHSRQLVRCHARLGILWSTVKAITMEGGWWPFSIPLRLCRWRTRDIEGTRNTALVSRLARRLRPRLTPRKRNRDAARGTLVVRKSLFVNAVLINLKAKSVFCIDSFCC